MWERAVFQLCYFSIAGAWRTNQYWSVRRAPQAAKIAQWKNACSHKRVVLGFFPSSSQSQPLHSWVEGDHSRARFCRPAAQYLSGHRPEPMSLLGDLGAGTHVSLHGWRSNPGPLVCGNALFPPCYFSSFVERGVLTSTGSRPSRDIS